MDMQSQVIEALKRVNDPELHQNLIELNMIEQVEIEGSTCSVVVLLTTSKCPLKHRIKSDIETEVLKVDGIQSVQVHYGEMDKEQKQALIQKLHAQKNQKIPLEGVRVVAVGSGKGGVGKSSVTTGLAWALKNKGYRVGVVDADILGYSIPKILGIEYQNSMMVSDGFILPIEKNGLRVISMGNLVDKNQAFVWRGPMLVKALRQFLTDVHWGELDFLLIDMPPGTGDIPLNLMEMVSDLQILLVTTPESMAQEVALRLGLMAKKLGCSVIGAIENMSYFLCDSCSHKHYLYGPSKINTLLEELSIPLLGQVPFIAHPLQENAAADAHLLEENKPLQEAFSSIAEQLKPL